MLHLDLNPYLDRRDTPSVFRGQCDRSEFPVHGEFVITLRLASGTDRGNGTARVLPVVPENSIRCGFTL